MNLSSLCEEYLHSLDSNPAPPSGELLNAAQVHLFSFAENFEPFSLEQRWKGVVQKRFS